MVGVSELLLGENVLDADVLLVYEHGDDAADVSLVPLLGVRDSCLLLKCLLCDCWSVVYCLTTFCLDRQARPPDRQTPVSGSVG